ncbi:hypothetical protein Tco_0852826 [Tanacetum coccineum]
MSYLDSPCYSSSTYTASLNSKTGSHRSGNILEDVLQSFVADTEPEQQLAYEDFDQIEKLDLEEMDLKWQIASTRRRSDVTSVFKEIQKIGKNEEDSKALITVNTLVDWTEHDGHQLTLEDKIRVLSIELENTTNLLKHSERINDIA